MTHTMACHVLHGKQDIRPERWPIPPVKSGEVLVKVHRMGICGSDVTYYEHGRVGEFVPSRPFILGHEASGEIVEVGSDVDRLNLGSRLAIDPSQPCRTCQHCVTGRYNLCPQMVYFGSAKTSPPVDGVFCEYFSIPADNCYRLPDHLTYAEAALMEPLSVAIHAVKRAGKIYGASVLILGGGTIGQLILLVARAFGAGKVALSEIVEARRMFAKSNGADNVLNPLDDTIREQMMDASQGGFDFIFEASGASMALRQALEFVRPGGTIVQVGHFPSEVTLPVNLVMTKELQIAGSFRFANVFQIAVDLASSGRLDLQPLVSLTYPMNEFNQAMQSARSKGEVIKVQVET